jgi:hypothetical protein
MRTVEEIAREVARQDNACTSHPMFLVQEQVRDYGYDPDYATAGGITECYLDEDFDEIDVSAHENPEEDSTLTRTGYVDRWAYVTACFTRVAAEAYVATQQHRHRHQLRVYVDSGYRNPEWQTLRAHLLVMGA